MRQPIAFLHHLPPRITCMLLLFLYLLASAQPDALRAESIPWAGYETLFLAWELGYYNPTKLHLQELSTATETLRAFRKGKLDVAELTLDEKI